MTYISNHYIPKYYLKGFCNSPACDSVWVYEKGSTDVFSRKLTNVAAENHRWPPKTEKYLTEQVEQPANAVIDKICTRQPITSQDKDLLSAYIVVMYKRVDAGLQRAKALSPKVIESVFGGVQNRIMKLIEEKPSKAPLLEKSLQTVTTLRAKYEKEFPMNVWYDNITAESTIQLRVWLTAMTWVFLTSTKAQQPFLTSDNPVFFFSDIGIGKSESEITFPISSNTTLWATWRTDLKDGYLASQESFRKEINRRTVRYATRYVYYSQNAPWVAKLVNKKPTDIIIHRVS